jgi:hypothetical protein
MIFFALAESAAAFGINSTAFSTSASERATIASLSSTLKAEVYISRARYCLIHSRFLPKSASVKTVSWVFSYITPKDMLAGRQQDTHANRARKLEAARKQRQIRRQRAA